MRLEIALAPSRWLQVFVLVVHAAAALALFELQPSDVQRLLLAAVVASLLYDKVRQRTRSVERLVFDDDGVLVGQHGSLRPAKLLSATLISLPLTVLCVVDEGTRDRHWLLVVADQASAADRARLVRRLRAASVSRAPTSTP